MARHGADWGVEYEPEVNKAERLGWVGTSPVPAMLHFPHFYSVQTPFALRNCHQCLRRMLATRADYYSDLIFPAKPSSVSSPHFWQLGLTVAAIHFPLQALKETP